MIETPKKIQSVCVCIALFLRIISSPLSFIDCYYYFKTILCVLPISLEPGFFRQPCACLLLLLLYSVCPIHCCLMSYRVVFACPSKLIMSCHRSTSGICVPLHILTHCIFLSLTIHYRKWFVCVCVFVFVDEIQLTGFQVETSAQNTPRHTLPPQFDAK